LNSPKKLSLFSKKKQKRSTSKALTSTPPLTFDGVEEEAGHLEEVEEEETLAVDLGNCHQLGKQEEEEEGELQDRFHQLRKYLTQLIMFAEMTIV